MRGKKFFVNLSGRRAGLLLVAALSASLVFSGAAIFIASRDHEIKKDPFVVAPDDRGKASSTFILSALNGLPRANATSAPPVAVVIENHFDARPLSGVAEAALVYEAPVEGGITRLLAFYDPADEVKEIGPVRSARSYFLDWANELEAVFAHVGGSPAALELLKTGRPRDLNEYFWGRFFWRSDFRGAPHNVYTSTELIREAYDERGFAEDWHGSPWRFDDASSIAATSTAEIVIPFSSATYTVRWRWDPVRKIFLRSLGNSAAVDKDGKRETAQNLAVAFVESRVIDEIGRLKIKTVGTGDAMMLRDGNPVIGRWEKPSAAERLRFYGPDGEEFVWRPGRTWIEIVPEEVAVDFNGVRQFSKN